MIEYRTSNAYHDPAEFSTNIIFKGSRPCANSLVKYSLSFVYSSKTEGACESKECKHEAW